MARERNSGVVGKAALKRERRTAIVLRCALLATVALVLGGLGGARFLDDDDPLMVSANEVVEKGLTTEGCREDAVKATHRALQALPPDATKVSQRLKLWLRESQSQGMHRSSQLRRPHLDAGGDSAA
jgi:hypothetical protein